jgi:hypothetical protein
MGEDDGIVACAVFIDDDESGLHQGVETRLK